MSQLNFNVSIVGANSRTKGHVPPSDRLLTTVPSSSAGGAAKSEYQLPCSPIAPARIILKNTENYPVYYKVFTDRPATTTSSSDHQQNNHTTNSNNNNNDQQQYKNVFVHPTRGAVKPHKSVTLAVVLAPPPDPTEQTYGSHSNTPPSRTPRGDGDDPNNSSSRKKRSQTPKKVSFNVKNGGRRGSSGGVGNDDDDDDSDDNNNNENSSFNNGPYCTNRKPILRMKIEAVVILSQGESSKRIDEHHLMQHHFVNNHEHEEEDQSSEEIHLHQQRALQPQHRSKISKEDFENRWKQGVSMPSRIFDIVSVKPTVSRDDYLHYFISGKMSRCDRLVRRCVGLENQCDTVLRRIEDLKEADVIERTKELEKSVATNSASIHVVALVLGIVASFAAGFSL